MPLCPKGGCREIPAVLGMAIAENRFGLGATDSQAIQDYVNAAQYARFSANHSANAAFTIAQQVPGLQSYADAARQSFQEASTSYGNTQNASSRVEARAQAAAAIVAANAAYGSANAALAAANNGQLTQNAQQSIANDLNSAANYLTSANQSQAAGDVPAGQGGGGHPQPPQPPVPPPNNTGDNSSSSPAWVPWAIGIGVAAVLGIGYVALKK